MYEDQPRRRGLRLLPLVVVGVLLLFQFFSAEKFVNPETGRESRVGLSWDQEEALGVQSYQQVLSESKTITSGPEYEMVTRVAKKLMEQTGSVGRSFDWRVSLVDSDQINAFCLPRGKIVVYTGILPVAQTEAGLAVVMGHEMAHATSRHGAQRVFQQGMADMAIKGVTATMSDMSIDQQRAVMGALGAGAQYGILMPFGRDHESEADEIGLMYMARAGYDPRESIGFWERMAEAGGGKQPPEFMSTHPSHVTRIDQLKALMPKAMAEYEKSGASVDVERESNL